MSTRHEDNDGSDIFWPGYVDATTNLILNLLFLLTILIVAVFMFALELGRSSPANSANPPQATAEQDVVSVASAKLEFDKALTAASADFSRALSTAEAGTPETAPAAAPGALGPVAASSTAFSAAVAMAAAEFTETVAAERFESIKENLALQLEIERLKRLLAEQTPKDERSGGVVETLDATARMPKPQHGIDKAFASNHEVMVRFKDDAIELTTAERDSLLESLQQVVANGRTTILVDVPVGFSEAKRMGFYRAMTIRNLLIEMNLPPENIDVSVVEVKRNANASLVRVRSH